MKLERIRGRFPLQRFTGSKYKIVLSLSFDTQSEKETMYRRAGIPLDTETRVFGVMYLDLDDKLMPEPYITLQYRAEDGKVREENVLTSKRWKGALEAVREYLKKKWNPVYGY